MARRRNATIETLIGADTVLRGDVNFTGGLYLEGRIEGNVNGGDAEARFDINESGRVVGEVHVANVNVSGAIEGELHADGRLILAPTARVEGNVFYRVLEMAAGAEVNGKLIHREQAEPLAIEHKRPEEQAAGVEASI